MARFHHTNLRIVDLERSLTFYGALGLTHRGTLQMGPGYTLVYLSDDHGFPLELVVNSAAGDDYDRSPGAGHIAFEVEDLAGTLALLAQRGFGAEVAPMQPAGRADLNPIAFVRDPDGVRVELLQRPWPVPQDDIPDDLVHVCAEFNELSA